MKKPSSRLNRAVMGILTALAFLLVIECVARVTKTVRDDFQRGRDQWYQYSPGLGWQRRPGFMGEIFERPVSFDAQGYREVDSLQATGDSTPRILTFGDSVTFGYGVIAGETFSEQLDARLPEASVINLGVNGYSVLQSTLAMEEHGRHLKPALAVLSGQYNDRRYVLEASDVDSPAHFKQLTRRYSLHQWSRRIYLVRGMALLMRKTGVLPPSEDPDRPDAGIETIDYPIDLEKVSVRVEPERYREQLTRAARWSREQGIPLIFMTLADNSHMTGPVEEAVQAEASGDIATAIAHLESLLEPENLYTALARRMLAELYRRQGRANEATAIAQVARPLHTLHGGFALYRDALYNRIMREVAEAEGVPLADAAGWLHAHPEHYLDQCHFNPYGHAGVAAILAETIAGLEIEHLGPVDETPPEIVIPPVPAPLAPASPSSPAMGR